MAEKRARGFTLIELMIAMTLGLLLMTAVVSVFVGSLTTYRTADALSRIQESARITMEVMRRDFRQAGFWGCRNQLQIEANPTAEGSLTPGRVRNTLNPGSWAFTFNSAIEGYRWLGGQWSDDVANTGAAFDPSTIAELSPAPLRHSDIVAMVSGDDAGLLVTAHPGTPSLPGSANLQVAAPTPVRQSDILIVSDCNSGAIFQVTNANPGNSGTLVHNTGAGSPGNRTKILGRSFLGASVYRMSKHFYYVAESDVTGRPGLFRDGEELAEDVERMRASFGVDTTGDQQIDDYVSADAVLDWSRVASVRFELILSSGDETNLVESPQQFTFFDGTTYTSPDRRMHQMFTITVGLRNRLP